MRVEASPQNKANRSPKARVLAELQEKSKLDGARPSDEVEPLRFDVKWAPEKGALGVNISAEDAKLPAGELMIVRCSHHRTFPHLMADMTRILTIWTLSLCCGELSQNILRVS